MRRLRNTSVVLMGVPLVLVMALVPAEAHHPITSDEIADQTIQSVDIGAGAVGSSEIRDNAVNASEIVANAVRRSEIASGAVGGDELGTNSISSSKIQDNAVTASEIAADAVTASEIAVGAVTGTEIADATVSAADLATNSVDAAEIVNDIQIETARTYTAAGSFQLLAADLTLDPAAGSSDGTDPDFLAGMMGNVLGADLTSDANYVGGVIGHYSVTGTNASSYPTGAVLGGISGGTNTADGAFVAYIDGDTAVTTAGAAFKVMNNNSTPGSGFDFGVDLQDAEHDDYLPVDEDFYKKAPLRLVQNVVVLVNDGAPVDGTTGDDVAGTGSLYVDSADGKLYINTGTMAAPVWTVVGNQS